MIKCLVLHGPNLNLLGTREPEVYGKTTFDDLNRSIKETASRLGMEVRIIQSNSEGQLIDAIHDAMTWAQGIVINPGAYTHYSYAIRDAIAAARLPAIEVHVSNVHARDEWRRHSVVAPVVVGQIVGLGPRGYLMAIEAMKNLIEESHR
ncbi:MAG: type II 3-dehydroquinate dehydratase [Chthonomonadales bacterium]|nr:type II 3-dehydroquinate dehydratase [Chthonomonadales bacterium]